MKLLYALFWFFFFTFIVVGVYYNTTDFNIKYPETTGLLGYILLFISIGLWSFLLYWTFMLMIGNNFKFKKKSEKLMRDGTRVEAIIEKNVLEQTDRKGNEIVQLTFSLKNFVGEQITESMQIVDSKPYEKRHEKGNKIYLRIDPDLKTYPYLQMEGGEIIMRKMLVPISIFSIFFISILAYYFYVYYSEGAGSLWNFLNFIHPLIMLPLFLTFFGFLFLLFNVKNPIKNNRIKYYGLRTTAVPIEISETGTRINDQPLVKFVLEFTYITGKTRKVTLTKIVSTIDLASVKQPIMEIFYEKENPENIALASDILN